MHVPRWKTSRAILLSTVAAVLVGVGCWVWARSALRLEVELGPGARFVARISTVVDPPYEGISLPTVPFMKDDVPYFPPGPDFPWAHPQASAGRAGQEAP